MSISKPPACWTCRLRKKKCDRTVPECGDCFKFALYCRAGDQPRPEWMEAGPAQDAYLAQVRANIRQSQAEQRRHTTALRRARQRQQVDDLVCEASLARGARERAMAQATSYPGGVLSQQNGLFSLPEGQEPLSQDMRAQLAEVRKEMEREQGLRPWPETPQSFGSPTSPTPFDEHTEADISVDFTVMYLDYVFPFLFPHYRPTIFEGGRAWVLATLQTKRPLYHTAMSLATYFMALLTQTKTTPASHNLAMAPTSAENLSEEEFSALCFERCGRDKTLKTVCGRHVWDVLGRHMDKAVFHIREDVRSRISDPNMTMAQRTHLIGNIVQLQIFEMAIGPPGGERERDDVHLYSAACEVSTLFSEQQSLTNILTGLDRTFSESLQGPGWRIWNTDQAAFRFALAVLLVMDIVDSTQRKCRPRLADFHQTLIALPGDDVNDSGKLWLEDYVGCQGWVLLIIVDIMNLGTWIEIRRGNAQSDRDLSGLAAPLSQRLHDGLRGLDSIAAGASSTPPANGMPQMDAYLQAYYRPDGGAQKHEQIKITRIWATAALLYLGSINRLCACSDCTSESVKEDMSTILLLMQEISSPAVLRSIAWPLFVAGCMANVDQRAAIRTVVCKAGPLVKFGPLAAMLQHLESIWYHVKYEHGNDVYGIFDFETTWQETPIYV